MRSLNRICTLLLLAAVGFAPLTASADVQRDRPQGKNADAQARNEAAAKNAVAADCEQGTATVQLDVNNVRADLYNTGQLFYPAGPGYEVPKGSGNHAIFATGLWIGGLADGELRMAAATYAQFGEDYEFFPGPLNDDGTVPNPNNCTEYDFMYKVSRSDIIAYEQTGVATESMTNWPYQLGAPVVDGDGNPNNYDLAAGDRPEVIGDQTVWWVMNDAAGPHLTTSTQPIGLEVQGTAFAFATGDALNNTTFYKYKLIYKPADGKTLEDVWFGIWSDPDLGNFGDDFVGSDTTLGLGFVYNGDPLDEGAGGYGQSPPAAGYDFFQGPLVNNDGIDNDGDGDVDEPDERLQMTRFVYFNNDNSVTGSPQNAQDFYGYLRGLWTDDSPMTLGGDGYGGTTPVEFMFPGDPPAFWSEDNTDGAGARNIPADRRFILSTGPFTMQPGDEQEIVFGIIWSQTRDRIGSVKQLKADDILAQGAFDFNFNLPPAPDAPVLSAVEMDEQIVLHWNNPPTSNNFLNQYDVVSPFLLNPNVEDTTYTFEGYKIYQYTSMAQAPADGTVIATIDVPNNNVTTIVDNAIDPNTGAPIRRVVATGDDQGPIQNFFVVDRDMITDTPLRNGTEYIFGVQAYAYNAFSDPQIRQSAIQRVQVIPSKLTNRRGGTVVGGQVSETIRAEIDKTSDAIVQATVVDPIAITGDQYTVRFYTHTPSDAEVDPFLTYDLLDDGNVVVSGSQFFEQRGAPVPLGENVVLHEGLSFTIQDAPAAIAVAPNGQVGIVEMENPEAPNGDPCATGGTGCPEFGGNSLWQALNSTNDYFVTASNGTSLSGLERWIQIASPRDFEVRFTEEGGYAVYAFDDDMVATTPFEIWDIGIGTPDDPSDDRRMIPFILAMGESTGPAWQYGVGEAPGFGLPASDAIYFMDPIDENGYEQFAATAAATGPGNIYPFDGDSPHGGYFVANFDIFAYPIGRFLIGDFAQDGTPPPTGTVIRIITTKPIAPGDEFVFDTESIAPSFAQTDTLKSNLDLIGIVPNPYKGASVYDRPGEFQDEARFMNMPEQATVRIFSLDGTLVRTLRKNSPDSILRWNLTTDDGLPIASGMYIVHIDVPDVGERVIKFGVILDKIHLDVF